MPVQWKPDFDAALCERNPEQISELCCKARRLIIDRMNEIAHPVTVRERAEREELNAAILQLIAHEYSWLPREQTDS